MTRIRCRQHTKALKSHTKQSHAAKNHSICSLLCHILLQRAFLLHSALRKNYSMGRKMQCTHIVHFLSTTTLKSTHTSDFSLNTRRKEENMQENAECEQERDKWISSGCVRCAKCNHKPFPHQQHACTLAQEGPGRVGELDLRPFRVPRPVKAAIPPRHAPEPPSLGCAVQQNPPHAAAHVGATLEHQNQCFGGRIA